MVNFNPVKKDVSLQNRSLPVVVEGGEEQTSERAAGPDLLRQRTALLPLPHLRQRLVGDLFLAWQRAGALVPGF